MTPTKFKQIVREALPLAEDCVATTVCPGGRWAWVRVSGHKLNVKCHDTKGWRVMLARCVSPWCETLGEAYSRWTELHATRPTTKKALLLGKLKSSTREDLVQIFSSLTEDQQRSVLGRMLRSREPLV